MGSAMRRWALVLAAGEGSRLRTLTTDARGVATPKQFCSLDGRATLLGRALERAGRLVSARRTATVVASEHRGWWRSELAAASGPVVVQPRNRGTAAGILLPLLEILDRDPEASLLVLPSDHFVADERRLERAASAAFERVERRPDEIVLLGIAPDAPDSEYGWIVPGEDAEDGFRRVATFLEKPPVERARELERAGGLWNSFLFVARAKTLVEIYERRLPRLLHTLRWARERPEERLAGAYLALEPLDFSRQVLEGAEDRLRLLAVPACGWSDLGTPERVAACLRSLAPARRSAPRRSARTALHLGWALAQRDAMAAF
jgi:mannose-1-phosphate guanylyltransferase